MGVLDARDPERVVIQAQIERSKPMSNYAKHLNAYLVSYKARCLGALELGTLMYRGQELRYDHILPKEHGWLNLLAPYRPNMQRYLSARSAIRLHRYFHHLNSSQAFALNLLYPYFEKGGAPQLLAAMGSAGHLSSWEPECIVDVDEGANVDVAWQSGEMRTYCEVKLSEQEFGSEKDDERRRRKLERIYQPVLEGACSPEWLQPEKFFPELPVVP